MEPFAGIHGDEVVAAIKSDPQARHGIPDWVDDVARDMIAQCWAVDSAVRPSFDEISKVLQGRYCSEDVGGEAAEVYC